MPNDNDIIIICLDFRLIDSPKVVTTRVGFPFGTSDHCFVSAVIKVEQKIPDISLIQNGFPKSKADWNGIHEDLSQLD